MRLEGINFLRGLAVGLVVIYHFFELLSLHHSLLYPYIKFFGLLGVALFFIISGYLIYRSISYSINYHGIKQGLKIYSLHRLFRILPAYYFNLIIVLGLASTIIGAEYFYSSGILKQIIAHLTFTSYFLYQNAGFGINGAYWTLGIEMLWYILAPFSLIFIRKKHIYFFLLLIACVYLWSIDLGIIAQLTHLDIQNPHYIQKQFYFSFQIPGQMLYFISGILIYKYVDSVHITFNILIKFLSFIFLIGFFIVFSFEEKFITNFLTRNIVTLFISLSLFLLFYKSYTPYLALLDWIGKISYSIYLWHMPILFVMKQSNILSHTSLLNTILLFIIILFSISSMSYYFIEEGGFRLRKKIEHWL